MQSLLCMTQTNHSFILGFNREAEECGNIMTEKSPHEMAIDIKPPSDCKTNLESMNVRSIRKACM